MSYSLMDAKWGTPTMGQSSGQILWTSSLDSSLDYNSSLYSAADFDTSLASAFQAWEDVASVDFEYTTNVAAADVVVGMGALPGSTVGRAAMTFSVLPGTDRIIDADITMDNLETWSPDGEGGGTDFFAVAAHEIGHAIGLEHVNDPTELMNPVLSTDVLGDGDIAGAQALYGADPGDATVPNDPSTAADPGGTTAAAAPVDAGDDGGSSGGLIALLLAALAALFTGLAGGGAGVGFAIAAAKKPEDDEFAEHGAGEHAEIIRHDDGHGHDHDHDHHHDHDHGEDLIELLDASYQDAAHDHEPLPDAFPDTVEDEHLEFLV